MPVPAELGKRAEFPFNPGEIVEVDGWPRWRTQVGDFKLELDIVSIGQTNTEKPEIGIASFVVMEQRQPFLDYAGRLLAREIAHHVSDTKNVLLLTAESKGTHIIGRVWNHLYQEISDRLNERIVTFRKGKQPKIYMKDRGIALPEATFRSITSPDEQTLRISPLDVMLILEMARSKTEFIFSDDFIGAGGTVEAVSRLFQQLELEPPRLVAVMGSDGNLYKETFRQSGINFVLLPKPSPLRLPTFVRENQFKPWRINM